MASLKLDAIISVIDNFSTNMGNFSKSISNLEPQFTSMRNYGTAAFAAITGAVALSIAAYGEAERSQRQLEHAVIDVSKGNTDQVASIVALTDALQAKTGIDGDAVKMGAAQLSTFGLQSESVVNLTKSLADLTVNQNGVNATSDDYVTSANTIAKALNGQFGALEKNGIRFTETQQNMILYGSEAEKVAAINEGLAQNLKETTDTLDGVDVATARASASFGEIAESLGGVFAGAANKALDAITPLLMGIATWIEENPKLTMTLAVIAGAVSAAVAAIGAIGLVLPSIIGGIAALSAALAFLAANPIILVIAAIAALVAGLVWLWNNSDQVAQYISASWEIIKQNFVLFGEFILPYLEGIARGILAVMTLGLSELVIAVVGNWEQIKAAFVAAGEFLMPYVEIVMRTIAGIMTLGLSELLIAIVTHWDQIKAGFTAGLDALGEFFTNMMLFIQESITIFLEIVFTLWSTIWTSIFTFFTVIWESIKTFVITTISAIVTTITEGGELIKSAWTGVWEAAGNIFETVMGTIKSGVVSSINWIIDKLNWFIGVFNKLITSGINQVPGVELSTIPTIPLIALAKGGIVTGPTTALIGEGGEPEAVVPLSKASQFGFGNGGGGDIYLTVNTNGYIDKRGFEKLIDTVLMQKLKRNVTPA